MSNEELVEKLSSVEDVLSVSTNALHKCAALAQVDYRNWENMRPVITEGIAEIANAYALFKAVIEKDLLPGTTIELIGCPGHMDSTGRPDRYGRPFEKLAGDLYCISRMLSSAQSRIRTCFDLIEVGFQDWQDMERKHSRGLRSDLTLRSALIGIENAYACFKAIIEQTLLPGAVIEPLELTYAQRSGE